MGRQPFLTRLAFGRSPFEPSDAAASTSDHVQTQAQGQGVNSVVQTSSRNSYVQQYDERGNPINPRAHTYGRRLRHAQNDVLSSIGVVERRPSPSAQLSGLYRKRLEKFEDEDSVGSSIYSCLNFARSPCVWWIGSLRRRVLAFHIPNALPFTQIIALQYRLSGPSLAYAGFPAHLLSMFSVHSIIYASLVLRPIDRVLNATRARRQTKDFFDRWRDVFRLCFRLSVEVLLYPLVYHAELQRLGLVPAALLPSWRSLVPFSLWSPVQLPSLRRETLAENLLENLTTSPLLFDMLQSWVEYRVYTVISEAIDTSVLRPKHPDFLPHGSEAEDQAAGGTGMRQQSPAWIRNSLNKMLVLVGWGEPLLVDASPQARAPRPESMSQFGDSQLNDGTNGPQVLDIGGRRVENLEPLNIPPVTSEAQILPFHLDDSTIVRPVTPSNNHDLASQHSPNASQSPSQDGNDPRIRIMSRGGIVEMEVRLPGQVISSHTEVAGDLVPTPNEHNVATPGPAEGVVSPTYHRVTQLSTLPAQTIGLICKAQMVGWVMLPLKIITLRLVASHYLARHGETAALSNKVPVNWIRGPGANFRDLDLRSAGILISRFALCGALEVAIDLTLWGCQWVATTFVGKKHFSWGKL